MIAQVQHMRILVSLVQKMLEPKIFAFATATGNQRIWNKSDHLNMHLVQQPNQAWIKFCYRAQVAFVTRHGRRKVSFSGEAISFKMKSNSLFLPSSPLPLFLRSIQFDKEIGVCRVLDLFQPLLSSIFIPKALLGICIELRSM